MQIEDKEKFKLDVKNLVDSGVSLIKDQNVQFSAFHYKLQYFLANKSELFKLTSRREYPAIASSTRLGNPKIGFLDVVWCDEKKPIAAFEIDSKFYVSSVWKLLNVDVNFRFWIYYGELNQEFRYMLMRADKDKLITLVHIPLKNKLSDSENKKLERYIHVSPPETLGDTYLITYNLYKQGYPIDEIAYKRGYSPKTITTHIRVLIEYGFEIDIDKLVSIEKQEKIADVSRKLHTNKVKEIKEYLGAEYSYEEIGFTLSKINAGNGVKLTRT